MYVYSLYKYECDLFVVSLRCQMVALDLTLLQEHALQLPIRTQRKRDTSGSHTASRPTASQHLLSQWMMGVLFVYMFYFYEPLGSSRVMGRARDLCRIRRSLPESREDHGIREGWQEIRVFSGHHSGLRSTSWSSDAQNSRSDFGMFSSFCGKKPQNPSLRTSPCGIGSSGSPSLTWTGNSVGGRDIRRQSGRCASIKDDSLVSERWEDESGFFSCLYLKKKS